MNFEKKKCFFLLHFDKAETQAKENQSLKQSAVLCGIGIHGNQ